MQAPQTPQTLKADKEIEAIKQSLAEEWSLVFPPLNSPSKTRATSEKSLADKVHTCIVNLYWKKQHGAYGKGALTWALQEFQAQAPAIVSQWAFKPRADSAVLPSRLWEDSKMKADFLHRRTYFDDRQQEELMMCLYNKLSWTVDKVTKKESYYPQQAEPVESIEIQAEQGRTPRKSAKAQSSLLSSSTAKSQAKISTFFRSKSEPNPPSSSEDIFGTDIDIEDVEMLDAPPSRRETPDLEKFETPPSTPPLDSAPVSERDGMDTPIEEGAKIFLPVDESVFKKPNLKRSLPEWQKSSSRKVSRESNLSTATASTSKAILRSSSSESLSLGSSFSSLAPNAIRSPATTAASSTLATPNTSFGTAYSADSAATSFDRSSNDTDATIRAIPNKVEEWPIQTGPTSPSKGDSLRDSLKDRLDRFPIFGRPLKESHAHLPFRQLYEVVRVALSCQMDTGMLATALGAGIVDYDVLWKIMTKAAKDHGKVMPQRSSKIAWDRAEHKFEGVSLGGRLRFVKSQTKGPVMTLHLKPMEIEKSYRLSRQFGSDRFCVLGMPGLSKGDVPPDLRSDLVAACSCLIDWLVESEHHFLGRKWRAFWVKPDKGRKSPGQGQRSQDERFKLYLFAEDGAGFRTSPRVGEVDPRRPDHGYMSVQDMLQWFMPADPNKFQPALKLFARIQLGVSKNVPTVQFKYHQIVRSDDAYSDAPQLRRLNRKRSDEKKRHLKPSNSKSAVMNDGCARISKAAAEDVAECLGLMQVPCAFQGRIGGAKGMWMVDALDEQLNQSKGQYTSHWIEITDSQLKFEGHINEAYSSNDNRFTFEVNDFARTLSPSSLSFQLMPILQNGGVKAQVFKDLLEADLTSKGGVLRAAMDEPRSLKLWNQRNNPVASERTQFGGIEYQGGLPASHAEKINWFLDHGFDPKECQYLKDQLYKSILAYCLRLEAKMDVGVGQSAYAFMLADPLGILEENEVQLCFSTSFYDEVSGFDAHLLHDQDVLVARFPAHLPSDIQRVRAVFKPELRMYRDVIIFSSKGPVPLAHKLSGGDYDGDKAWVCWEPNIVTPFANSPLPEESDIKTYGITKDQAKTADFIERDRLTTAFIKHGFNFNLQSDMLGICTHYHAAYCYWQNDISSPEAQEIGQLLGLLVDSAKGGFVFTEDIWVFYLKAKGLPRHMQKPAHKDREGGRRTQHLIDILVFDVAPKQRHKTLGDFAKQFNDVGSFDEDLSRVKHSESDEMKKDPEFIALTRRLASSLDEIFDFWKRHSRVEDDDRTNPSRRKQSDTELSFRAVAETCRSMFVAIAPTSSQHFKGEPESDRIRQWQEEHRKGQMSRWDLLKASVAFCNFHKKSPSFLWHMAGIELGEIKATAKGRGTFRIVINPMFDVMKVDGKVVEGVKRREDLGDEDVVDALFDGNDDVYGRWDWADDT